MYLIMQRTRSHTLQTISLAFRYLAQDNTQGRTKFQARFLDNREGTNAELSVYGQNSTLK